MSRHIAIFTIQSHAHIYPTLGLCTELASRGYRVSYPTVEPFVDLVRQAGAEAVPLALPRVIGAEEISKHPVFPDPQFWKMFASISMPRLFCSTAGTLKGVEAFYTDNAPDLIIYDLFSFAGRILAKRLGVPAIQHWAMFAHQRYLIREEGVYANPEPMVQFSGLLDSFLSAYGIDGSSNLWHREELFICFVNREFQFDASEFDDRYCFVGPVLNRPPRAAWKTNNSGKPTLLITESEDSNEKRSFFQTCVDAFSESEFHVVYSVGNGQPKRSNLPRNFQLNVDSYNTEILPGAALTICQAGMGATQESLYYGVPVLAVPISAYHAEVSFRVAELGLGVELPEQDLTARALRENVYEMLNDEKLLSRVRRMQGWMQNSGGAKLAATRIDRFLADRAARVPK